MTYAEQTIETLQQTKVLNTLRLRFGNMKVYKSDEKNTVMLNITAKQLVTIEYDVANDLYNVEHTKLRGIELVTINKAEGLYVDQMLETVLDYTGTKDLHSDAMGIFNLLTR